jgi:signal transduction histidine kinase
VELALTDRDNEHVVGISDTGPGISKDEREIVMRASIIRTGADELPGVGLGLNLVAAIIKLHGFRLTITSGPGSVVEITCPRA